MIFGVGTGDYRSVLNEYYLTHDLSQFAKENYNAHNQFIETLFSVGIIGLLALMVMMARPLYVCVKSQNALGFLTFFPFFIYGMTEVFLGRYQGVIFFAMLHQVFLAYYHYNETSFALKDAKV